MGLANDRYEQQLQYAHEDAQLVREDVAAEPERITRGRYTLKVWREASGNHTAMAGVLSADGTWWPAGVAVSRKGRRDAVDAAVVQADQQRSRVAA